MCESVELGEKMKIGIGNTFNLKNWNTFERLWIGIFVLAGTVVTIQTKDSILNYVILITGILCVVLAAKGNIWNYAFGLINSFGYAYVSFTNGLYGDMGLNLFFFVPTSIIGFIMWKKHLSKGSVEMRGLKWWNQLAVGGTCLVLILILGYLLSMIKTQNTPYIDSTSTILSIIATLLMMWRYKEQWILYIILNIVTIVMWVIRLLNGSNDGSIMIIMWTAFLVNAVYGYFNWLKGSKIKANGEILS
jgi:nicotinamide mononucleotide transporter